MLISPATDNLNYNLIAIQLVLNSATLTNSAPANVNFRFDK
jgi:hypothetical protein